jgi:hypothetical protein
MWNYIPAGDLPYCQIMANLFVCAFYGLKAHWTLTLSLVIEGGRECHLLLLGRRMIRGSGSSLAIRICLFLLLFPLAFPLLPAATVLLFGLSFTFPTLSAAPSTSGGRGLFNFGGCHLHKWMGPMVPLTVPRPTTPLGENGVWVCLHSLHFRDFSPIYWHP